MEDDDLTQEYFFDDAAQGTGPNADGNSGMSWDYDNNMNTGSITGTNNYSDYLSQYEQPTFNGIYGDGFNESQVNPLFNYDTTGTGDKMLQDYQGNYAGFLDNSGQAKYYSDLGMQQTGGIQDLLSRIFSGKIGENTTRGLAALMEGYQNKKKAAGIQNIVNQNRQTLDPFGSQRPQYQQELSRAVTDPYSAPIVANQVNQIADAQARKDAAAGRRSNSAGSAPAVLAAQAKVAQDYINSLYTPSGANIAPQGSAILSALMQGNNADVNGYLSPIMSALGYGQKQMTLDDIKALLSSGGK
jgi:hypothetical protein